MNSAQLRAARALLNWTQSELSTAAGIADRTIRLFEAEQRQPQAQTLLALQAALESAGVIFMSTDVGVGVLLRDRG
jgi:transcriptional regulator with XRE-family HTH domain